MNYTVNESWLHIEIDALFDHQRLLDFFMFYKVSKKMRYLLMKDHQILVNQNLPTLQTILHMGDIVSLLMVSADRAIRSDDTPLSIAYEDECILIVNKEPGLLIHSDGNDKLTLCNRVQGYYDQTKQRIPVRPIHRLDKDTSGLVIFCKIPFFQAYLDDLLTQKKIHREYKAVVTGKLEQNKVITVRQPIGRDRHDAKKQRISKNGKDACTIVTCEKYIQNDSLVHCTLKTGRTHQIRVHMAYLKHPILSDPLYGKPSKKINRLALHAYKITCIHPITQKEIIVEIDLPNDFPV